MQDTKDEKYFIPNIEELKIGYECEINALATNDNKEDKWYNTTIQKIYHIEAAAIALTLEYLRVPYLTEEQIIAEGWTEYVSEYRGAIRLENMNYLFFKEGSNYMIAWFFNENRISILVKDPSKAIDLKGNIVDYNDTPRYTGECKDINTFRYICKLLKI